MKFIIPAIAASASAKSPSYILQPVISYQDKSIGRPHAFYTSVGLGGFDGVDTVILNERVYHSVRQETKINEWQLQNKTSKRTLEVAPVGILSPYEVYYTQKPFIVPSVDEIVSLTVSAADTMSKHNPLIGAEVILPFNNSNEPSHIYATFNIVESRPFSPPSSPVGAITLFIGEAFHLDAPTKTEKNPAAERFSALVFLQSHSPLISNPDTPTELDQPKWNCDASATVKAHTEVDGNYHWIHETLIVAPSTQAMAKDISSKGITFATLNSYLENVTFEVTMTCVDGSGRREPTVTNSHVTIFNPYFDRDTKQEDYSSVSSLDQRAFGMSAPASSAEAEERI